MKLTLRELFLITLIVAIVVTRYARIPEYMTCPCCGSEYDTELVRSINPW